MVGLGRTTFYRHLDKKKISVNPEGLIDVSELIRVYGNENVMTLEQREQLKKAKQGHKGTQPDTHLADEVKRLRTELENVSLERKRERDQLSEEIDHLRSSLEKSMEQNNSLTRLLTDERERKEDLSAQKQTDQETKLEEVLKAVKNLEERQNKGWWPFRKSA